MSRVVRRTTAVVLLLAVLALLGVMLAGCGKSNSLLTEPQSGSESTISGFKLTQAELQWAIRVQEANTPGLMATPGVVGTAITVDEKGRPAIMVLTESPMAARLPSALQGYRVIEEVSGKIVAMKGGGGGVSHTAKQTAPIQLGTSGGNVTDLAQLGDPVATLADEDEHFGVLSRRHAWDNRYRPDRGRVLTDDWNPVDLRAEEINLAARRALRAQLPDSLLDG